MAVITSFILFFMLHLLIFNSAESTCPRSFSCGNITDLEFPLSNMQPECGLFMVNCTLPGIPILNVPYIDRSYEVLDNISPNQLLVRDPRFQKHLDERNCLAFSNRLPIINPSFYLTISPNLTIYTCNYENSTEVFPYQHFESYNCTQFTVYYKNSTNNFTDREIDTPPPSGCLAVQMPVKPGHNLIDLFGMFSANFTLEWNITEECKSCHEKGGQCTGNTAQFFCKTGEKRMLMWIIIAVVTAVVTALLLLLAVAALVCMRQSKRSTESKRRKGEEEMNELLTLEGYTEMYEHEKRGAKGNDLRMFTYATIVAATRNFSSEYKLGEGGFGPVYKGQTIEGREIAVKVLSRSSGQGLLEFKTELILISKLQHVNLVKLVGFCIQQNDKIIIYDYMPNKSLDFFLFDPTKREQLDWVRRVNIIEGIAQGLLYLHKHSRLSIVHRDLKCSNILLDENLNPKISDFGLARIFKQNIVEANTNRRVGTFGYMAPEYAMQGIFSFKSDVYSFGVLVLETVTGRKNNSFHHIEGPLNLVEYAWELWGKNTVLELMDPTLNGSCNNEQFHKFINISLLCVENRAVDRPNIEEVLSMVKNETTSLALPKNPAFITRNSVIQELGTSTPDKQSANEFSISEIGGR